MPDFPSFTKPTGTQALAPQRPVVRAVPQRQSLAPAMTIPGQPLFIPQRSAPVPQSPEYGGAAADAGVPVSTGGSFIPQTIPGRQPPPSDYVPPPPPGAARSRGFPWWLLLVLYAGYRATR